MAEIKSMGSIRDKWTRITPGRTDDYKSGIKNPRRDWAEETEAAEDNWRQGIEKAAQGGMFGKGVRKAGTDKWKEKALSKGPGRFAEGVYAAGDDYNKGFEPYHKAIQNADLGPRFPRRDPRNLNRVKAIVEALIKEKIGS